ncbi:hypothetical protein [Methylobacterium nigriterrae]|uniref:hypothetical protein n=1 Tax=Methylobacterium nigriterrae TaxID=3127512 RepID=UPI003014129F
MFETSDDYCFVVYSPPMPGLPWLSVCFGPAGAIIDTEAFATFEEADIITQKARETLNDSLLQRHMPPAGAVLQ